MSDITAEKIKVIKGTEIKPMDSILYSDIAWSIRWFSLVLRYFA